MNRITIDFYPHSLCEPKHYTVLNRVTYHLWPEDMKDIQSMKDNKSIALLYVRHTKKIIRHIAKEILKDTTITILK